MVFNLQNKGTKVKTRFALFPIRISDQIVWLQKYYIAYKFLPQGIYSGWVPFYYIDKRTIIQTLFM